MSKIIGIDLGTTNSCVAINENGKTIVIENAEGNRTTPSIVAYTSDDQILVGLPAKRQAITNPKNTLFAIKRLIGRKFAEEVVQKDISMVPYTIVENKNGDAWVKVNKEKKAPPQVSAEILKKMKKTAEDFLGEKVTKAVITVPAYFNDSQRQATKDAGKIAGLEVERIINEPTAAALAYGLDKKTGDKVIAVYDLGGGTFDISIIEIADVDGEIQFEVKATNGDTFLGGEDFDLRLIEHLIKVFKKETGLDLKKDPSAMQRIKEAAEKAKVELSFSSQTEVNLPYITADSSGPKHLVTSITRSKLESLVEDLVIKSLEPCKTVIEDAELEIGEIDEIILVGGQTRMPLVQQKVSEFFGKELKKDVNPDEAVAMGASIQGAVLSGDIKDVLLLDVSPLSLGIETLGGIATSLIEKNTTIPTSKSQVFSTAEDNQSAVTIHVVQGERKKALDNKSLGRFDLSEIPPSPRGMPQIKVTFDINANGILNVSARDEATGKEQSIVIKAATGLNEEEVEKMIKEAEKNEKADKEFEEIVQAKNSAEGLVHTTRKLIEEGKDKIEEAEKTEIEGAIKQVEEAIKLEDKEAIKSSVENLTKFSAGLSEKMYKQNNSAGTGSSSTEANQNENVDDADFEDIDENENKK